MVKWSHSFRIAPIAHAFAVIFASTTLYATSAFANDDAWHDVRAAVFGDKPINDGAQKFSFFAPKDAEDAALVPISLRLPSQVVAETRKIHLIIDRNPAPVAAQIEFGPGYRDRFDIGEREFRTRIRIDSFSNVRAILEMADGQLYMHTRFVAGAGGCSAPSSKDPDAALANLGETIIKVRQNAMRGKFWREGVVMIRHPNFTGMQMNAKTGKYTPARFVKKIEVRRSGELMFVIDGGISISENPNFRFSFGSEAGADHLTLDAVDTEGVRMTGQSTIKNTLLLSD